MFQFPVSPVVGQLYNPSAGITFRWNGVAWYLLGTTPGVAVIADAEPVLSLGQLWFESDTGSFYIRYQNPDLTYSLVGLTPAGGDFIPLAQRGAANGVAPLDANAFVPAANLPPQLAGRNRMINGDFRFDQINEGGYYNVTTNAQGPDGWTGAVGGSGSIQIGRIVSTDFAGEYDLILNTLTTTGTIAAGDFYEVYHVGEGWMLIDAMFGTASAKPLTLSFEVRSTLAGNYCVKFGNAAGTRSYIADFTINAANTYERKVIAIPPCIDGAWGAGVSGGFAVLFPVAAGSTFRTAPGVWTTGNFVASTNMLSNFMSSANSFRVRKLQLEVSPVATPFERLPYGDALRLVQRSFYKSFAQGIPVQYAYGTSGGGWQSGMYHTFGTWGYPLPVHMRAAPTISFYNPSAANSQARNISRGADCTSTAINQATQQNIGYSANDSGFSSGQIIEVQVTANARLS